MVVRNGNHRGPHNPPSHEAAISVSVSHDENPYIFISIRACHKTVFFLASMFYRMAYITEISNKECINRKSVRDHTN